MCYRVDCKICGKYSWSGCGKHLASLYRSIDEGKHCMCRSWPGVVIPTQHAAGAGVQQPTQAGIPSNGNGNPEMASSGGVQ